MHTLDSVLFGDPMIIYENTKKGFSEDVLDGIIEDKLDSAIREKMGRGTPDSEKRSWISSLGFMNGVLLDPEMPNDMGVAVEYKIPHMGRRVDVILSGYNSSKENTAIVVELKQWNSVEKVEDEDGIVKTALGGGLVRTEHPSYQAWSYVRLISDYNEAVQELPIPMYPCAFLHNYVKRETNDPLLDPIYQSHLDRAPVFTRRDQKSLQNFIKQHIKFGDNKETLYLIDNGKLKPSKSLQDSLSSMMNGNQEFIMIDDQKVVYESIFKYGKNSTAEKKHVTIVRGGPGTGKSVLAVNLLVNLTREDRVVKYVTKNQAPRSIYSTKLKNTRRKTEIDNLFGGTGGFYNTEKNLFDVLLVDEAHRLNEKSGLYRNLGENQIKELIDASKYTVFFIDERQRVTLYDIGTEENILKFAKNAGADVDIVELVSQFRCNGSDGYMSWVEDVLQIEETANFDNVDGLDYDIRIFEDPNELRKAIEEKNAINNKSRLVAGYCWNWISEGKKKANVYDIRLPEFDFEMSWNLETSTNTWAIDPESVNEAGCIHTCQGLEFDYVGVIIGDDLRCEKDIIITDYKKRAKSDQSLKGILKYSEKDAEKLADEIIRNTYRTLMTRGMYGCYIYCTDRELSKYFEKRIKMFKKI